MKLSGTEPRQELARSAQRYAAIDIGTVTCRMLVAEVDDQGIRELAKEYAITNLGEDVDRTGLLKPEAMRRVGDVIDGYLELLESLRLQDGFPIKVIAMATSASRDARNADEFVSLLSKKGIKLTVIPGYREASLSFMGASSAFLGEDLIVVDIGGGSTEVIAGTAGSEPLFAHSFDIGCRRVTERFLIADPPDAEQLSQARAWIREEMTPYFKTIEDSGFRPGRLVAVAGTATSMVSIRERMVEYDSSRVDGAVVTKDELEEVARKLRSCSLDERRQVVGLDPGRAPVIVAGTVILQEILRLAGVDGFTASEADILQGIILDAARQEELAEAEAGDVVGGGAL